MTTALAGVLALAATAGVVSDLPVTSADGAVAAVDTDLAHSARPQNAPAVGRQAYRVPTSKVPTSEVPTSEVPASEVAPAAPAAPGPSTPAPAPEAARVPAAPKAQTPPAAAAAAPAPQPISAAGSVAGALTTAQELKALPTSGAAWTRLLAAANTRSGSAKLADQDSKHAAQTLASALVFARTGDTAQRDHVVSVLRGLPNASLSGARVLSVARQLGGYALAADLVGYRDAAFTSWIGAMRTKDLGNHGRWTAITATSEDSANNWGTWAMASRIAVSSYLRDTADLQRAATVFRGFTGDRAAYSGFRKTAGWNSTWACGGEAWVPINPASCGDRGGAFVEDISRSSGNYPSADATGLMYSWEAMGGAMLSARLLERAGYSDVWSWSDRALLRAAQWLKGHGGYPPPYSVTQHIPHMVNSAYDVNLGPVAAAGHGRQFGFTDWLQ